MKFIKVEPRKSPYVVETDCCDLEYLQKQVQGYIEVVPSGIKDDILFVVNEEGKLNDLPPNRYYGRSDVICGDILVLADDGEGDFTSLSEEQIKAVMEYFEKEENMRGLPDVNEMLKSVLLTSFFGLEG